MFAVIYQGYIKPGKETQYQEAWNQVARFFVDHRGALGSCLHKTNDGLWIAYSRWPDKETRDASWSNENAQLPSEIRNAILIIKECLDQERTIPEICMEVVNNINGS